ncbi:uncharacterized protein GJ701_016322 isoform 2-T2 [Geothlypis trichas]
MPGAAVASDHPLGLATRACTKRRQRELFASRYRPRRPLGPAGTPTNIRLAAGTHLLRQSGFLGAAALISNEQMITS